MNKTLKNTLNLLFLTLGLWDVARAQSIREVQADYAVVKGKRSHLFNECVGAGRANEGLRADWQKQLAVIQKGIGFKYIRFHGLLHDDMGVYTEDNKGNPIYNWQYVDVLFDYLKLCHIRPFVELSFMPSALKDGNKTVFWWKANVTGPSSYAKWTALITSLVKHFESRYGVDEVEKWPFEIWNEPNHPAFSIGDIDEYFKLYDASVIAIKAVNPKYKVGGPATAGTGWITQMLKHCEAAKVPIDFISTHDYGVEGAGFDEFGVKMQKLRKNPNSIARKVDSVKKLILQSAYPKLDLHFTEWSSSYSSKDPVHDSYQNAAFVLNTLKKTELTASSMSYWVFTDIFEEAGPPRTAFEGGFGLLNTQGIKKPTYYSYHYLSQLDNVELKSNDTSSWVCKNNNGNLSALIYDFSYPDEGQKSNQVYFRKVQKPKDKGLLKFRLDHIPNGTYSLRIFQTGYQKNDPFTTYYRMGLPGNLSVDQLNALKNSAADAPVLSQNITIKNHQFMQVIKIRENDIFLFKLTKK